MWSCLNATTRMWCRAESIWMVHRAIWNAYDAIARALAICLHKQMITFQQDYWNHTNARMPHIHYEWHNMETHVHTQVLLFFIIFLFYFSYNNVLNSKVMQFKRFQKGWNKNELVTRFVLCYLFRRYKMESQRRCSMRCFGCDCEWD